MKIINMTLMSHVERPTTEKEDKNSNLEFPVSANNIYNKSKILCPTFVTFSFSSPNHYALLHRVAFLSK